MNIVWKDVRFAFRTLRRDIGFTAMMVLVLALGIGLNTAVFSVVRSVLLEPLPYRDADRLAMVWSAIPEQGVQDAASAYANVADLKAQSRAFEDLGSYDPISLTLTGGEWPERIPGVKVSANLFSVLGAAPAFGRVFSMEEEEQRAPVVVLSHGLWQRRLGGTAEAVGQTVEIGGERFQVIGVMPETFSFPNPASELWLPQTLFTDWEATQVQRGTGPWRVVGRLNPGVELSQAREEVTAIAAGLERMHPEANAGVRMHAVALHDQVTGSSYRLSLWALFGAVGLVLVIACANGAHMMLARGVKRGPEFAIRRSLGASTARLLRQVLTESMVLVAAAGVAGVLLAVSGLRLLVAIAPSNLPRLDEVAVDAVVLIYATAVSVAVGILFAVAPVLGLGRSSLQESLRAGGSHSHRMRAHGARKLLIVIQFAMAIVLVFGASLLVRSLMMARGVDPGFQTQNVLMANLSVESAANRIAFYEEVVREVRTIPGVLSSGIVEDLWISGAPSRAVAVEGANPADPVIVPLRIDAIAGDLFDALGVPVREGRSFSGTDGAETPPVAIVNESMAQRFWPGESPLGKRFRTGDPQSGEPWIEVVGVVGDMRRQGPETATIAQAFRPYAQAPSRNMVLLIRSDLPLPGLAATVRTRIAEIDRTVPLYMVTPLGQAWNRYVLQRRFQAVLLGFFSGIALLLATVGVYGLIQYSVTQRAREIGVRIALGGTSGRVISLILRQGLSLAIPGLVLGMTFALLLARLLSSLFFGVAASDASSILFTSALLLAATVVACYLPARRAATIDPMQALRSG